MKKIYCKLHRTKSIPYIVCCHVIDGTRATHHQIDDVSGEIVCDRQHWPPQPGDRNPSVMCAECAKQFIPDDAEKR